MEQISSRDNRQYSAEAFKVGDGLEREPAKIGEVVLAFGRIGRLFCICLKIRVLFLYGEKAFLLGKKNNIKGSVFEVLWMEIFSRFLMKFHRQRALEC